MNLRQLLGIEYAKFSKNPVIKLLIRLYLIILPIAIFIFKELDDLPDFLLDKNVFFIFPTVWDYMGYIGNWLTFFFLGVVAVYLFSIEVSNRTLRQSVINGLSRQEYFMSKLLSIFVIAFLASLYYGICSLVVGFFHTDDFSISAALDNDWAIARYFLMTLSYMVFALLVAILIRKPGLAVFNYLSYVLVMEVILRYGLNQVKVPKSITKYFPMNVIEDLHPLPFYKIPAANIGSSEIRNMLLSFDVAALGSFIYLILFIFLAYRLFMTRDM